MAASIPLFFALAMLADQQSQPAIHDTVTTGVKVTVTDDRGVMMDGRVEGVSDQALRLAGKGGSKDIPIAEIVRIERPDGVKNGALTGLGVGVGFGTAAAVTAVSGGYRGAGFAIGTVLANGLVCAGIGALIDAAIDGRRTLYQRGTRAETHVAPLIDRRLRGLAVSINW